MAIVIQGGNGLEFPLFALSIGCLLQIEGRADVGAGVSIVLSDGRPSSTTIAHGLLNLEGIALAADGRLSSQEG
jgi:hypothetical protein